MEKFEILHWGQNFDQINIEIFIDQIQLIDQKVNQLIKTQNILHWGQNQKNLHWGINSKMHFP